ncbi:MAG: lipopolysaccharide transport periplasmic protein LptA [Lysobacteraceae bacterium]|nr:lipopolysaccharide transport periplasmic protein LptA [Xanthomonadales bacterium]MCP5477306.1 lipopolysaccharide transport periplasmic protein LptA [Rhodanobacteraceae bacterium]HPF74788.1 lipopolysaccharide transport periplasmic protein LptA [Xanthomonadaceae bacterium]HRY01228.1 lipopolysaccharide transport periplasmic protein LptA [Xanthomonadaceae bacterium]
MNRHHAPAIAHVAILLALSLLPLAASARSSDRDKPMDVSADHTDTTLQQDGTAKLSGDVRISQGTLDVRADNALVKMASGEISHVTLTGAPATMRQEKDDGGITTARAQRIEYDLSGDRIDLYGSVTVDEPGGSLSGEHLSYDLGSGRIEGGGEGNGRVNLRILPNNGKNDSTP